MRWVQTRQMFENRPRQMIAMIGFPNVVDVIVRIVFGRLETGTC